MGKFCMLCSIFQDMHIKALKYDYDSHFDIIHVRWHEAKNAIEKMRVNIIYEIHWMYIVEYTPFTSENNEIESWRIERQRKCMLWQKEGRDGESKENWVRQEYMLRRRKKNASVSDTLFDAFSRIQLLFYFHKLLCKFVKLPKKKL